jgi:flagellar motor switch protein FliG
MSDVEAQQEKLAAIIQNLEASEEIVILSPDEELLD